MYGKKWQKILSLKMVHAVSKIRFCLYQNQMWKCVLKNTCSGNL